MGYDFLGTLTRKKWDTLYAFFLSAEQIISPEDGDSSTFIRHILAEVQKANTELRLLEIAGNNFFNFSGDLALKKDKESNENRKSIYRLALADGDTAAEVASIKTPLRLMLKRKKDNLEYRIKKIYDLIDQLENKYLFYSSFSDNLSYAKDTVETHFSDGLHYHNTSEDESLFTEDGYIDHSTLNVSLDYSDSYDNSQTPPTYYK